MAVLETILKANHDPLRPDIRTASAASGDVVVTAEMEAVKAQVLHAARWIDANVPPDVEVKFFGVASAGKRTLGAPVLGILVLTQDELIFLRDDSKGKTGEEDRRFELKNVSGAAQSGMLGTRTFTFTYKEEEVKFDRLNKGNAKKLVSLMETK